jgi:hypothetical protein
VDIEPKPCHSGPGQCTSSIDPKFRRHQRHVSWIDRTLSVYCWFLSILTVLPVIDIYCSQTAKLSASFRGKWCKIRSSKCIVEHNFVTFVVCSVKGFVGELPKLPIAFLHKAKIKAWKRCDMSRKRKLKTTVPTDVEVEDWLAQQVILLPFTDIAQSSLPDFLEVATCFK